MSKKTAHDTLTLKPSQCATAIRLIVNTERSMFLWGPPGISKSAQMKQVATSMGIAFIDVRLSQMDPTDLRGIPYPVVENGVHAVRWSPPVVLPRDLDYTSVVETELDGRTVDFMNPVGDNGIHYCTAPRITVSALEPAGATATITSQDNSRFHVLVTGPDGAPVKGRFRYVITGETKGILALEEFNSAPPSVAAAAYQLVLDRKLGDSYVVPKGVAIIAAGNRDTDKGITFKMATPIANRYIHIEMRHDFDDWQKWALTDMLHPDVVGYLSAFKGDLFDFDPSSAARGFQTPRSWHALSDFLIANPDAPDAITTAIACGAVGEGAGLKFAAFRKIAADLPRPEEILSGRLKEIGKVEAQLAYALTTNLCYTLKESAEEIVRTHGKDWAKSDDRKKWLVEADNFLAFMMKNFQPEICIMGAKGAVTVHELPFDTSKMKNFEVFTDRFKSVIMGH